MANSRPPHFWSAKQQFALSEAAAAWSAVRPDASSAVTAAPARNNVATAPSEPRMQARCSAARPSAGRRASRSTVLGAGLSQRFELAFFGGRPEPLLGRCLFFFLRTRGALVPARFGDGGVERFVLFGTCEEVGHFGTQLPQPGAASGGPRVWPSPRTELGFCLSQTDRN